MTGTVPEIIKSALALSKGLQDEVSEVFRPPQEGYWAKTERVIPLFLVKGTRGYIEKVANQINGCYENGWYDACAVMIRRLMETLLIEAFEHNGIADKIKDTNGNFLPLEDIINSAISETAKWNLSRDTKRRLPKLKQIGDRSAHSRRFNARKTDLDEPIDSVRLIVEELLYISGLRR